MAITLDGTSGITTPGIVGNLSVSGNTTVGGTLTNTGLITASAGVAIGGVGAANTLDDYEEGTWTPTLGNVSAPTFTSRNGTYTKIGSIVYLTCEIIVASGLDTSDGSAVYIQGFPFTGNSNNETCVFSIGRLSTLILNTSVVAGRFLGDGLALKEGGANELAYNECASSGTLQFACTYSTS